MNRGMEYHIYSFDEETGTEFPLNMSDGRLICFRTEERAKRFLEAIKRMTDLDEENSKLVGRSRIKNCIVYSDDGYIYEDEAEKEVFGHLLSESPRMFEKIEELLGKFYFNDTSGEYDTYGHKDSSYDEVRIDEAISALFVENGFKDEEYNCGLIQVFDNSSATCYALAISWIECDKLEVYNDVAYLL